MGNEPWTWDWNAVAALAGGAAALLSVLAIIVAALAARASARAATAAERQLVAQTTPVVVEVPRGAYFPAGMGEQLLFPDGTEISVLIEGDVIFDVPDDDDIARCSVPVPNIGSGIARITRAYLDFQTTTVEFLHRPDGEDDERRRSMVVSRAQPTHIWLPPNGRARLMVVASKEDEDNLEAMRQVTAQPENFAEARILFSDASGAQCFATLLHLRQVPDDDSWRVYQQWTRPVSD